ncbi:hypothetical protein CEXT_138501 [Caerostris extrusa]|uniref:Uncharacterized protein n=1 Tax=Caerostris extrusa TaxID=172846 RepID=A0AAV4VR58_CAEEX|nr:hypothetical protein CEXT_138501 [Caerostris extrusa]
MQITAYHAFPGLRCQTPGSGVYIMQSQSIPMQKTSPYPLRFEYDVSQPPTARTLCQSDHCKGWGREGCKKQCGNTFNHQPVTTLKPRVASFPGIPCLPPLEVPGRALHLQEDHRSGELPEGGGGVFHRKFVCKLGLRHLFFFPGLGGDFALYIYRLVEGVIEVVFGDGGQKASTRLEVGYKGEIHRFTLQNKI